MKSRILGFSCFSLSFSSGLKWGIGDEEVVCVKKEKRGMNGNNDHARGFRKRF